MRKAVVAGLVTALLVGCASSQAVKQTRVQAEGEASQAGAYLRELQSGKVAARSAVKVFDEGHYMPLRQVDEQRVDHDPVTCAIEFNPVSAVSLYEISQAVSESCHIRVRITPDAMSALARLGSRRSNPTSSGSPENPAASVPDVPVLMEDMPAMGAIPMFGSSNDRLDLVNISWSGQISGLLDAVTSRLGLSWRHRNGVVSIFYLDTRVFHIDAIPSESQMESIVHSGARSSSGVSSGSQSGGGQDSGISGSSGSTQLTSVTLETDFMGDLENTIQKMLTPTAGRMSLSRSAGSLTVTDTAETLDRIAIYVEELNEFATKQVLLNVKVLSVTLNDSNELGINWDAVYTKLSSQYGLNLSNALSRASDAISGSVSILEGGDSRFSGSDLVVSALSHEGRVSVITQPSVTTLNLEPVPVQVARQVSYLERVELGQTAQVGSTTSLTPGSVTTGFNMVLLPHILSDSETVLLQYSMNLSSLDNLRTVTSGGSTIEIPEIDNRIFNQKVKLKSNETLIISGFEQVTNDSKRSGVGSPGFWGLGGGHEGKKRRDVIVVLITPVVMN